MSCLINSVQTIHIHTPLEVNNWELFTKEVLELGEPVSGLGSLSKLSQHFAQQLTANSIGNRRHGNQI